jgi:hypothetical protein
MSILVRIVVILASLHMHSNTRNLPAQQDASDSTQTGTTNFDGSKAFEHVRQLVQIGPRPSGSEAIRTAQAYIVGRLRSCWLSN